MPLEYIEITVNHGDTLWTLAKSIAPNMDPRKVVWDIQEINGINNRIFLDKYYKFLATKYVFSR